MLFTLGSGLALPAPVYLFAPSWVFRVMDPMVVDWELDREEWDRLIAERSDDLGLTPYMLPGYRPRPQPVVPMEFFAWSRWELCGTGISVPT